MIESELPLTIVEHGILPDTGGAGRFRGGMGLVRDWRVDCAAAVFTASGSKPPAGAASATPPCVRPRRPRPTVPGAP